MVTSSNPNGLRLFSEDLDTSWPVHEAFAKVDQMLGRAEIDHLRLVVTNFSIKGRATDSCGLVVMDEDDVSVQLNPELLIALLNHPKFRSSDIPIVLVAAISDDPSTTFEMIATSR